MVTAIAIAITMAAFAGCDGGRRSLVLASTSSVFDSGLLDTLVPAFEAAHPGISVKVLAVGSGEALEMGRRGDADVLLVHSPEAERAFVAAGWGHHRTTFMRNDFVVAGPTEDPAAIRSAEDVVDAFTAIAAHASPFLSRGDDSGTHARERRIWRAAGVEPEGDWYREVGQGMGATLLVASERQAYLLTDRATLLGMRGIVALDILYPPVEAEAGSAAWRPERNSLAVPGRRGSASGAAAADTLLRNLYSVIEVTRAADSAGAAAFARWLRDDGREVVRAFGVREVGRPLFQLLP